MEPFQDTGKLPFAHLSVDSRSAQHAMSHQLLDVLNIRPVVEQMRRERIPQNFGMDSEADPEADFLDGLEEGAARQWLYSPRASKRRQVR